MVYGYGGSEKNGFKGVYFASERRSGLLWRWSYHYFRFFDFSKLSFLSKIFLSGDIDKSILMWYIQFRNWKSKFDFEKEIWNLKSEIKLRNGDDRPASPLMAIKEFCMECCGWERSEVKSCSAPQCPLFEFRFGKNPYNKRTLTDEQKEKLAERMKKARESKKDIWKINQISRDNSSASNLYPLNYLMKLKWFS